MLSRSSFAINRDPGLQDGIPLLPGAASPATLERPAEADTVQDQFEVEGWPTQPRKLSKPPFQAFLSASLVVLALVITFPYIILAAFIRQYSNQLVSDSDKVYQYIKLATQLLHNIFPYAFSFTAGQTVKIFATWRLQRGVSLGELEQIMGSTTVSGAMTVHTLLLPLNIWTIGLTILWASSPIGNYLIPKLAQETPQALVSNVTIKYLDTAQASVFYESQKFPEAESGGINALYQSGLISSQSSRVSSMDQWGNIKIPYYDRLDVNITANTSGWKHPPETGPSYSALLGIPFSGLTAPGNTTFVMTTTYLDLDCYNISRGAPMLPGMIDANGDIWTFATVSLTENSTASFFLAMNGFISEGGESGAISAFINATNGTEIPHNLLFQSRIWDNYENELDFSLLYCSLSQEYVDATIFCSSTAGNPHCYVTAMRPSPGLHASSNFTILGLPFQFSLMSQLLPIATGEATYAGPLPESTATELFIGNSSIPFSYLSYAHLYEIPKFDLEVRLGQVLNTYYLASLDPSSMTGSLESGNASTISVDGENVVWQTVFKVNWTYWTIYLATWIVFFVAGLGGVVLKIVVIVPDLLGYMSSLTRDNPYVQAPVGGSTLDGMERTKLLRRLRLRISDVGAETDRVGYVTISSDNDGGAKPLTRHGLYS